MSRTADMHRETFRWIGRVRPVYRFLARPMSLPLFAAAYVSFLGLLLLATLHG